MLSKRGDQVFSKLWATLVQINVRSMSSIVVWICPGKGSLLLCALVISGSY